MSRQDRPDLSDKVVAVQLTHRGAAALERLLDVNRDLNEAGIVNLALRYYWDAVEAQNAGGGILEPDGDGTFTRTLVRGAK